MSGSESTSPDCVYQIKTFLQEISPMVWRRLLVSGDTTLVELHKIIQLAMGWEGHHLWTFSINDREYGCAYGAGLGKKDYETMLSDLGLGVHERFLYTYDFGDYWRHEARLEKVTEPEPNKSYPVCIGGKRARPPEDCGGPRAYQDLLHLARSPFREHERRQALEILGGSFDPEAFDRRAVNAPLKERTRL